MHCSHVWCWRVCALNVHKYMHMSFFIFHFPFAPPQAFSLTLLLLIFFVFSIILIVMVIRKSGALPLFNQIHNEAVRWRRAGLWTLHRMLLSCCPAEPNKTAKYRGVLPCRRGRGRNSLRRRWWRGEGKQLAKKVAKWGNKSRSRGSWRKEENTAREEEARTRASDALPARKMTINSAGTRL